MADNTDAEETRPPVAKLTGVRYEGFATTRLLSKDDLVSLGAESPKGDLVWNGRGDIVKMSELNASTVDALLTLEEFTAI